MTVKIIAKNALHLFDYALENGIAANKGDLCEKIGLLQSAISKIKNGERSFTHEQLHALANLTRADMNWLYGFSTQMFRPLTNENPTQRIRKAVAEIELIMSQKALTPTLTPGPKQLKNKTIKK